MSLVSQLKSTRGLYAECPSCGGEFPVGDALLFDATAAALPAAALKYITQRREDIAQQRRQLQTMRKLSRSRPEQGARSVSIGKVVEKIAPSLPGFPVSPRDCRSLFEPIDYIVFNGLSARGEVESLTFVDVKSGNADLNTHQRQIKRLVECGEVRFTVASAEATV
jgi:predicted Holliday junction resolvase-like endonuclease